MRSHPDPTALGPVQGLVTLPSRIAAWRARRKVSPVWTAVVALVLSLLLLPVATVLYLAGSTDLDALWHLASTVLPDALKETVLLLIGAGVVTLVTGTATAWVVTMYRFPGRSMIDRLLIIPLAMPTYIIAYAYVELLDYAGPIQSGLRHLFGWRTAADYWFPSVRSLGGAIMVLSAVLYPYVYLTARASFVQQSVCALEVARTLGRTPFGAFTSVALPLARPALVAGVSLVLMECLNDLGAVQHLGVRTLSSAIWTTWQQRSSLGGAAQIATVLLILVVALFAIERGVRGGAQFHHSTGRYRAIPFADITGWRAFLVAAVCAVPFVLGFLAPALVLAHNALRYLGDALEGGFWRAAWNSLLLAALAALASAALGLLLAYARRVAANGFTRPAVRVAGLGYALPGTVLALGLFMPLAGLDIRIDAIMRSLTGISTGLMLSGTVLVLIIAYCVRFLAVSLGTIEAGLERISPNLDAAARTLGETALSALWRVHLPLLVPAIGTAALLVFVDAMKELPATLLLRPFDFETLATHVYSLVTAERPEAASVGALAIVAVGLVPVLLLHRAVAEGRAGH